MADPTGEADRSSLRLDFDRRLMLQFRGSTITSDGGLLAYRELDDALSLTDTAADALADARTGKNGRHRLAGLLRQSVFGRLAGYEDVNDAEQLCRDPAMRWVVGDRATVARLGVMPRWLLADADRGRLGSAARSWRRTCRCRRRSGPGAAGRRRAVTSASAAICLCDD